MALEESLAKLDVSLTERSSVPMKLLLDDYTGVAGSHGSSATDPNCELMYRLLATSWIGPWGSCLPWLLPPSSIERVAGKTRVILRIPQSRVRHFLTDASLYIPGSQGIRITRAILRLGADRVIQSLDSELACNVSLIYKHARRTDTNSDLLTSPLFFDSPLRVLPLFVSNTPLPEIEYELSGDVPVDKLRFLTQFVSSIGEVEPLVIPSVDASKTIVQHLPCFTTFTTTVEGPAESVITVDVSASDEKLVRALYFRVRTESLSDADVIDSIEVYGPPPKSSSLLGQSLPASLCRGHLKSSFSKNLENSPYYVLPFALCPSGNTADYGLILNKGSQLKVTLTPTGKEILEDLTVDVCVETFERVVWKR